MSKELIDRIRELQAKDWASPNEVEAADLIEAQQSWIASLEQNARDADRIYKELETELAASQAHIKVMREALYESRGWNWLDEDVPPKICQMIEEALAQPTDDSALRELLKSERERCAKVCDRKKKEFAEAFKDMADESLGAGQCAAAIRAMGDQ